MNGYRGVIFRAVLYFSIGFLAPFSDQITDFLQRDQWPSLPRTLGAAIVGLIAGLTALRAFYDGSAQRHEDKISSGTQFIQKPQP